MSERKQGFYWVKDIDHPAPEYWEVWFYDKHGTWSCGTEIGNPAVIGGRIPTPDEMEGWQVVPIQPVEQQIDAGCEATGECERLGECHLDCDCSAAPKVYRAMLAAAPKPGDV